MRTPHDSIVIRVTSSAMVPFIQLFALYVIVHGHYSPGGGFQGGIILAVSIMLMRLYLGKEAADKKFSTRLVAAIAAVGMLIFMLAGLIPMTAGGMFLDFGSLPIPGVAEADLRYFGILIVEIAIGLTVFGTLVLIFDNLIGENW